MYNADLFVIGFDGDLLLIDDEWIRLFLGICYFDLLEGEAVGGSGVFFYLLG